MHAENKTVKTPHKTVEPSCATLCNYYAGQFHTAYRILAYKWQTIKQNQF